MTLLSSFCSCSREDMLFPEKEPHEVLEDTPEEILVAVSGKYSVESVSQSETEYIFSFDSPSPITIRREYPEGIPSVSVPRSVVGSYHEDGRDIIVEFVDGKTASLQFSAWLSVRFNGNALCFDGDDTPKELTFEVTDSCPDSISVSVDWDRELVRCEPLFDALTQEGKIVVCPVEDKQFATQLSVRVSNGRKTVIRTVSVSRTDFRFADGTLSKEFSFPDYERYFELEMHCADTSVKVSTSAEWIRATVTTANVDGVDRTVACILVSENREKVTRTATVSITRTGSSVVIPVTVRQAGFGTEGSLRYGLESFYGSLNGNSWARHDNWCTDRPLFEWYGVSACQLTSKSLFGEEGFVYFGTDDRWSLDLAANGMRGEIPMCFWKACRSFENIRISSEYLPTSTVPACVWHDGLVSLDLSMSFMNVPLTDAVKNAVSLKMLDIQCCNVGGCLPEAFTGMTSLERVNMRECSISGHLPASIGNLKNLRELYLDHNMSFGGTLPDSFYSLVSLTDFDISATEIGGVLKREIRNLRNLEGFWICGCEFEGTIPEEFGLIGNLVGYDFDGNYFTALPEFVRYYGYNSRYAKEWVGSAGFPVGVPYYQRNKDAGRPENYIVEVPDCIELGEIIVDGKPLRRPGYYVDFSKCRQLPFPVWAHVRYGIWCWTIGRIDEMKYPLYPVADDLQYPADEYYYDGTDWRHPKLEFPAREYYRDGDRWMHDPLCPWDREYVDGL